MAIRTVVTSGYGNGTFNGTIPLVVTRGYAISSVALPVDGPLIVVLTTSGITIAIPAVSETSADPGAISRTIAEVLNG